MTEQAKRDFKPGDCYRCGVTDHLVSHWCPPEQPVSALIPITSALPCGCTPDCVVMCEKHTREYEDACERAAREPYGVDPQLESVTVYPTEERNLCACGAELMGKFADERWCGECLLISAIHCHLPMAAPYQYQRPDPKPPEPTRQPSDWDVFSTPGWKS